VDKPISQMTLNDVLKWPWNCRDTRTWKYIDFEVRKDISGKHYIHWIANPAFAYKHLDGKNQNAK